MHENLRQNVNEHMFSSHFYANFQEFYHVYKVQLKQLISYMIFNPFKIAVQLFLTASSFPNFDDPNAFPQIQQAPGSDFRS